MYLFISSIQPSTTNPSSRFHQSVYLFVFLLQYIYRRQLLPPFRKMSQISNLPLIDVISSIQAKHYKCSYLKKKDTFLILLHQIVGDIWNHRKKLQDLHGQNLWKIFDGCNIWQFLGIFMNQTIMSFFFYFKDYYI